jgi:hypothetical protein
VYSPAYELGQHDMTLWDEQSSDYPGLSQGGRGHEGGRSRDLIHSVGAPCRERNVMAKLPCTTRNLLGLDAALE